MAYERSSLISRSGYSGLGRTGQLSSAGIAQANAAQARVLHLSNFGDDPAAPPAPPLAPTALSATLTSAPVLIGAAVLAYFVFGKKKKKSATYVSNPRRRRHRHRKSRRMSSGGVRVGDVVSHSSYGSGKVTRVSSANDPGDPSVSVKAADGDYRAPTSQLRVVRRK